MNNNSEPRIDENLDFLLWLYPNVKNGYLPLLNVAEMQNMVAKIVAWYETKYPNKNSAISNDNIYYFTENNLTASKSFDSLLCSLNGLERKIFEGGYRMGRSADFVGGTIGLCIVDQYNQEHALYATAKDGILVGNLGAFEAVRKKGQNLRLEALQEALTYFPEYNINELARITLAHECDVKVRDTLLTTVTLAIKNSEHSLPLVAEARAKKWVEDVNAYFKARHYAEHPDCQEEIDFSHMAQPKQNANATQTGIKRFIAKRVGNRITNQMYANFCTEK